MSRYNAFVLGISFFITMPMQAAEAPVFEHSEASTAAPERYIVHVGDTLYSVAWMYHLDYRDLVSYNHLTAPYIIHVGQPLQIRPLKSAPVERSELPESPVFDKRPLTAWQWPAVGRMQVGFSSAPLGNKGIDVVGRFQTPIYATEKGVVVYSGAGVRGYGNLLIIKHSQDYLSAYAFNWRNLAKEGDTVQAGQKIAMMGRDNSGQVLLHFEVRHRGVPVDPLRYLSNNPQG